MRNEQLCKKWYEQNAPITLEETRREHPIIGPHSSPLQTKSTNTVQHHSDQQVFVAVRTYAQWGRVTFQRRYASFLPLDYCRLVKLRDDRSN